MGMREKSKYTQPCNRCGYCCAASLCPAAEIAFPNTLAPCPALSIENDEAFCGLVKIEEIAGLDPVVRKILGIGCGCSCPDANTTEKEIEEFDELSEKMVYG